MNLEKIIGIILIIVGIVYFIIGDGTIGSISIAVFLIAMGISAYVFSPKSEK